LRGDFAGRILLVVALTGDLAELLLVAVE